MTGISATATWMQTVCAAISTPSTIVDLNALGSGSTDSRRNRSNPSSSSPAHTERTVAAVITFTSFAKASRAETWPAPRETATPKSAKGSSQVLVRADMESARESARLCQPPSVPLSRDRWRRPADRWTMRAP